MPQVSLAQRTGAKDDRYTSYQEHLRECMINPHKPRCAWRSWTFRNAKQQTLEDQSRRYRAYQLDLARRMQLQKEQRARQDLLQATQMRFIQRALLKLRLGWLAMKQLFARQSVHHLASTNQSPFDNTGGFGHAIRRSSDEVRGLWVYQRGRLLREGKRIHQNYINKQNRLNDRKRQNPGRRGKRTLQPNPAAPQG